MNTVAPKEEEKLPTDAVKGYAAKEEDEAKKAKPTIKFWLLPSRLLPIF